MQTALMVTVCELPKQFIMWSNHRINITVNIYKVHVSLILIVKKYDHTINVCVFFFISLLFIYLFIIIYLYVVKSNTKACRRVLTSTLLFIIIIHI
jgi:hypothetical protein